MGIAAIGSSAGTDCAPSNEGTVRSLDIEERNVQRQLESLQKESGLDQQLKAEEVLALQSQLQMLADQIAQLQSQAAGAGVPRVDPTSSSKSGTQNGPPYPSGTLDVVV